MKKVISSLNAPKALGPYSQAIEANGFVYISGQLGISPLDGKLKPTVEEQAKQALENMSAILAAAGCKIEDVVKTTVLLQDIGDFGAVNEIYASVFSVDPPARACYQVAKLPAGGLVEIESIAVKP